MEHFFSQKQGSLYEKNLGMFLEKINNKKFTPKFILGNLGPLASKPVMEGKSLLFKRFANIDSIDIEVEHETVNDFVNTVANIADSFGGINLEDIKAPECFEIEKRLKGRPLTAA